MGTSNFDDIETDNLTVLENTTFQGQLTVLLAALPQYADQAAAAAALPAGRLFRFTTTGAIGVALT